MVSHFAIPSKQHLGGSLPYVFTVPVYSYLDELLNSLLHNDILLNIML